MTASTQDDTAAGKRQSNSARTVATRSSSIQLGIAPHMADRRPRVSATPSRESLSRVANAAYDINKCRGKHRVFDIIQYAKIVIGGQKYRLL